MPCNIEALTQQFYDWERRGRGWQVWDFPVALEPPFRPFLGHFISGRPGPVHDDGRRPTFLSNLVSGLIKRGRDDAVPVEPPETAEPEPTYVVYDSPVVELQAALPPDIKITKEAAG
jgi:hypothetical protein